MNEFVLFAVKSKKANKTNSFVCFLGESTARQSAFWFYLTFLYKRPFGRIRYLLYLLILTILIVITPLNSDDSLMICTCTLKLLLLALFMSIFLNQCGMAVQSLYTPYHCVSIEQQQLLLSSSSCISYARAAVAAKDPISSNSFQSHHIWRKATS